MSAYNGINNYNVDLGGFGSAQSRKTDKNTLTTSSQLSQPLQNVFNTTTDGLNNNLQSLAMNPEQQLQSLNAGNNSFYNLQAEGNQRYLDNQLANATLQASRNGIDNSTVYGGLQGTILNDAVLRDLTTRNQALTQQNALANANAATQNATLQGLAGFAQLPAQIANQNLQTGFGSRDQTALANAQMQTQVNMQNAAAANAAAQQRQQMWGQLASAGIQLAAAPFTGGASLLGGLGGMGAGAASRGLSAGGLSAIPFLGSGLGGF